MNQKEMAVYLAEQVGCTVSLAEQLLVKQTEIIIGALQGGDVVGLGRLGKFYISQDSERVGRNPNLNESIVIPARKTVRFRVNKKIQGNFR